MEQVKYVLIGMVAGLAVALFVFIKKTVEKNKLVKKNEIEIENLKKMLSDRMDIESEGLQRLKKENEELKSQNENLRITNASLMQKPGRSEVQRLSIYQKAVDRLVINSPGFGAAWQSALKESEAEFEKIYNGTGAFWKKVLPSRTNAKLIDSDD